MVSFRLKSVTLSKFNDAGEDLHGFGRINWPYQVESTNFWRRKIEHVHDNSADSEMLQVRVKQMCTRISFFSFRKQSGKQEALVYEARSLP